MNEKYIERPKKFNQREYNREYTKNHYKTFSTTISPNLFEDINNYCQFKSISKAEFLRIALEVLEKQ